MTFTTLHLDVFFTLSVRQRHLTAAPPDPDGGLDCGLAWRRRLTKGRETRSRLAPAISLACFLQMNSVLPSLALPRFSLASKKVANYPGSRVLRRERAFYCGGGDWMIGKIAMRSPRTEPSQSSLPTWMATVVTPNPSILGWRTSSWNFSVAGLTFTTFDVCEGAVPPCRQQAARRPEPIGDCRGESQPERCLS